MWLSTSPMQLDSDGLRLLPFVGPAVAAELRALHRRSKMPWRRRGGQRRDAARSNESSRRRARDRRSRASAQRRAAPQPSQDSPGSAAPLLKIIPMVVEEMSKILLQNDEAVYASERRARSLESACRVQNERLAVADARVVNIVSQLKVAQAERGRLERALADTRPFSADKSSTSGRSTHARVRSMARLKGPAAAN